MEPDEVRSKEQQLVEEIHSEIEEVRELVMDDVYNPATIRIPEELPDDRNHITDGDKVILIVEDDINFAKALLKYAHSQHYKGVVVVREITRYQQPRSTIRRLCYWIFSYP
ncbi:hypothetical protein [Sphingobacterium sp. E70]|uniref:hypothetical protein n=1 Tax=Sphingobacterium sp. E70 TaxID=2853439 RepID=UPI00279614F1|nr:hypothetical protein [Sphingobacterium sp. E70]